MSTAVLPKPQLRGFYAKRIKFHLFGGIMTSIVGGLVFKVLYTDRRKKRHRDFIAKYNPERHMQVMLEHNLLQSAPRQTPK